MKVSLTMLLKTNVEKMSPSISETMSLETHDLHNLETMLLKIKVVSGRRPAARTPEPEQRWFTVKMDTKVLPIKSGVGNRAKSHHEVEKSP